MGRMTKAEREEKAQEAVELSARGFSYRAVASRIGVNWKTAKKLIEDELAVRAEGRDQDKERHLAVYDAIQRAAWERFRETDNRSLNSSGYLNTIKAAEDSKVKITGAEAPSKSESKVDVAHRNADGRDEAFEQLFAELDAFGTQADAGNGEGGGGVPVDTGGADDPAAEVP